MEDAASWLADHVDDLPELRPVLVTPSGVTVVGFSSAGETALAWWERLRDAHAVTGLWPLLIDDETPEYLAERSYAPPDPMDSPGRADSLDGAAILAQRGERNLRIYGDEIAEKIRAELRGNGTWPADPVRRGFDLPTVLRTMTVALIPATTGWQVPAVLEYGGWNDYPVPDKHAAILRHWHQRHGADLVVMTGTTVELAVAHPPSTRPDALALAWEYMSYNDGRGDYYRSSTLTDLAASLLGAAVLLAWWD